jgi:hypothetical protein
MWSAADGAVLLGPGTPSATEGKGAVGDVTPSDPPSGSDGSVGGDACVAFVPVAE